MNEQELFLKSKCPICNNIFVNDFSGRDLHIKRCNQINHNMIIIAKDSKVDSVRIAIKPPNGIIVTWSYNNNIIKFQSLSLSNVCYSYLKWFEPDFSDYKKLIKKIKTYVVFS